MYGGCARLHDCLPIVTNSQGNDNADSYLAAIVDKEMQKAMLAYTTMTKSAVANYAAQSNKVLKEVYGCNH